MFRREDPWEFEHSQTRLSNHERSWLSAWMEDHPGTTHPPTVVIVCPQCRGKGVSSLYLGSYTQSEMEEDPDFYYDYMEGVYDRTCESCDGRNVVQQLDPECMPAAMRQSYEAWMRDAYESDAIQRQEFMMGA